MESEQEQAMSAFQLCSQEISTATAQMQSNQLQQAADSFNQALLHLHTLSQYEERLGQKIAIQDEASGNTIHAYTYYSAISCHNLGVIYLRLSQVSESFVYLQKALSFYQELGSLSDLIECLTIMERLLQQTCNYPAAIQCSEQIATIAKQSNDSFTECKAILNIGIVQHNTSQYDQSLVNMEKALEMSKEIANAEVLTCSAMLNIGLLHTSRCNYAKALEYLSQAEIMATELNSQPNLSQCLRVMGTVEAESGNIIEAKHLFKRSLAISKEISDWQNICACYTSLGNIYQQTSKYQKALNMYQEALPILRQIGMKSIEAICLINLGNVTLFYGEKQQALEYYREAQQICHSLNDISNESKALFAMSSLLQSLTSYDEAIETLEKAGKLSKSINDQRGLAYVDMNLGNLHKLKGEFSDALTHFLEAKRILEELSLKRELAGCLLQISGMYTCLGDSVTAMEYSEQSKELHEDLGDERLRASTLVQIASDYNILGEYGNAVTTCLEAIEQFRKLSDKKGESDALSQISVVYRNLGQYKAALTCLNHALEHAKEMKEYLAEAEIATNIGLVYSQMGDLKQALTFLNNGLHLSRNIQAKLSESNCLMNLGHAYEKSDLLENALVSYQQCLEILQQLNIKSNQPAAMLALARVLVKRGDTSKEGLETLEDAYKLAVEVKSKKMQALILMAIGWYYSLYNNPDLAIYNLYEATKLIMDISVKLHTTDQVQSHFEIAHRLLGELVDTLFKYNRLPEALIATELKNSFSMVWSISQQLDSDYIEPLLAYLDPSRTDETNPLETIASNIPNPIIFFTKCDGIYIWIKKRYSTEFEFVRKIESNQYDDQQLLRNRKDKDNSQAADPDERLYDMLFSGLEGFLPDDPEEPVIIVPDPSLLSIPFYGLKNRDGRALIESHTLIIFPSVRMIELSERLHQKVIDLRLTLDKRQTLDALLVGDPSEDLQFAREEVTQVYSLLLRSRQKSQVLTKANATKNGVLQGLAKHPKIFHFSGHSNSTLISDANSEAYEATGYLRLAGVNDTQNNLSNKLHAVEIQKLKLPGTLLTVLSSCNSGKGKQLVEGEAGIVRSLFIAGVPSIVATLDYIPDDVTKDVITRFYRNLIVNKETSAAALRHALLESTDLVDHWGLFRFIGHNSVFR